MSRQFLKLPLSLATLLCLGATAALPARADISINSVSGIPDLVPATRAFIPVLVDCGGAAATPTGTATLTDSDGKVVSQNDMNFYQKDAHGNPVVYAYLVFPGNQDATANAVYTVTLNVNGSDGTAAAQSFNVEQGFLSPVQIMSVTPSSSTLSATAKSFSISALLAYGGQNQGRYTQGEAVLKDGAGKWLEIEPLTGQGADSGNATVRAAFSNVPANTSASAQSYTVSVIVQDNTGVASTASVCVTQLPATSGGALGSAGTTLTVTAPVVKAGQNVKIRARLHRVSDNGALSGQAVSFSIYGTVLGTATTDADGLAMFTYAVPATMMPGKHTITASFAGNSAYAATAKDGSFTVKQ